MTRLLRLGRDERGTSVIELAVIAPILATLLVGMVDISRAYSLRLQLEQAAQRAIEKAMQGKKAVGMYQALKADAAEAAGVAQSAVTVDWYLECNGTRQTNYNDVCDEGETFARYVTVSIQKTHSTLFRPRWFGSGTDGAFTITGKAGVRVQ